MGTRQKGFSLIEVTISLIILGLTCSSVLVIMNRNMHSTYNVTMRLRALEIAREHLEAILVSQTVKEMTETGTTETSPAIDWEDIIETFYSPVNGNTWARARCTASYEDMDGQVQSVELEHWLTAVSDAQMQALEGLTSEDNGLIDSVSEAAAYAGESEETINDWIDKGMAMTPDGRFIKANLDLFIQTEGNPSPEDIAQQPTTVGTESDMTDNSGSDFSEDQTESNLREESESGRESIK